MSPRLTASSHSRRSAFSSRAAGELLDRRFVAAVERLLDQLAAAMRPAGQCHALLVQIVVAGAVGAVDAELDHQPAQFRARKAGADDRAMHAVVHVVDRRAPLGDGRREFTGRRFAGSRAPSSGLRRGGNADAAGGRPVEKTLPNISGARDDMLRYIRRDTTFVAHIGGLEKRGRGPSCRTRACGWPACSHNGHDGFVTMAWR